MLATGGTTSPATTVTYSDLGEDDSTDHTAHSSIPCICHTGDVVHYSQRAFQSSSWGIGDISNNQYHSLVDDESDDPDLSQQLGLPLYTSSPTKLQQKTQENTLKPKHQSTVRIINKKLPVP